MVNTDEIEPLIGGTAYDSRGDKAGTIGMVYLDDQTNRPEWVTVTTGLFGGSEAFVPLDGASAEGDSLRLAYTTDQIKDAPSVDADSHLEVDQEEELYRHYGRSRPAAGSPPGQARADDEEQAEAATDPAHGDLPSAPARLAQ